MCLRNLFYGFLYGFMLLIHLKRGFLEQGPIFKANNNKNAM